MLVDCGLYQGLANLRRPQLGDVAGRRQQHRRGRAHPRPPRPLRLPARAGARRVRRAASSCTADTAELAAIVLRDSAHLQEEDAAYANDVGFSKHRPALPLYDAGDVEKTLPLLERVEFLRPVEVAPGVRVTLQPGGPHPRLGHRARRRRRQRACCSAATSGAPDTRCCARPPTLRRQTSWSSSRRTATGSTRRRDPQLLADAIRRTIGRGGSVLVPAFAVDRTELVLLELRRLMRAGQIPKVPVFVDSPMALAALDGLPPGGRPGLGPAARRGRAAATAVLEDTDLHAIHDTAGSQRLNRPRDAVHRHLGLRDGHRRTRRPPPRPPAARTAATAWC